MKQHLLKILKDSHPYWRGQIALVAVCDALDGVPDGFNGQALRDAAVNLAGHRNAVAARDGEETGDAVSGIVAGLHDLAGLVETAPRDEYMPPSRRYRENRTALHDVIAATVRTVETGIPFAGFYETWHGDTIDRIAWNRFEDENGELWSSLWDLGWIGIQWHKGHDAYAGDYARGFLATYGIRAGSYVEMTSPREYNFTTDRIFVKVPAVEFMRVLRDLPADDLDVTAAGLFTSYDGFSSFYSPNVETWGNPLEDWDYNQRYAVMKCLADNFSPDDHDEWERDFAGEYNCNWPAETEAALYDSDCPRLARAVKIADYLKEREYRRHEALPGWPNLAALGTSETAAPAC